MPSYDLRWLLKKSDCLSKDVVWALWHVRDHQEVLANFRSLSHVEKLNLLVALAVMYDPSSANVPQWRLIEACKFQTIIRDLDSITSVMLPFEAAYAPSSSYLLPKDLNLHFVCKVAQLKFRQEGKTRIRALAAEQTVINQPLPPRTLQSSITSSSTTRSDAPKQISVISTSRAASVCSSIFLNPPTAQSSVTHKIERRSMVTHPIDALMRPITFDKMMEINRTFQREHEQVLAQRRKELLREAETRQDRR